jgi:hypothetical protein
MFVCFLLKNILTTFYGCQTAEHFIIQPPSFEDYISQGPRAHPIPRDIIFSRLHLHDEHDDDDNDDDNDDDDDNAL